MRNRRYPPGAWPLPVLVRGSPTLDSSSSLGAPSMARSAVELSSTRTRQPVALPVYKCNDLQRGAAIRGCSLFGRGSVAVAGRANRQSRGVRARSADVRRCPCRRECAAEALAAGPGIVGMWCGVKLSCEMGGRRRRRRRPCLPAFCDQSGPQPPKRGRDLRRWTGIEPAGRGSPVPTALKAAGPTRCPDTSLGMDRF